MDKKEEVKLIEGSRFKIISIGGRDTSLETEGVFKGYMSIGIEEAGLIMEMGESHGAQKGRLRIVPLHAILAIDIIDEKKGEETADEKESTQYYG